MVTEEQKKIFADFLNNTFNETIKSNEETYQKTSKWIKNVYYKYVHDILPNEHREALENRLDKRNITIDEFLETKGNIDIIQELSKSRKPKKKKKTKEIEETPIEETTEEVVKTPVEEITEEVVKIPIEEITEEVVKTPVEETTKKVEETPKEKTITEKLEEERNELEKEIFKIENMHSKKYRTLNRISDEEYAQKCEELKELKQKRLEINRKLDAIKVEEERPQKEKEAAAKKIEELLTQNRKKDDEINSLKEELATLKSERFTIKSKYSEEYDQKFEVYSDQAKEDYENKLNTEIQKQISKINQKFQKDIEMQKAYFLRLLFKKDQISIEELKTELEKNNISTANLDLAISDIRMKIPGITRYYDLIEKEIVFSINGTALHKWNDLETNKTCPKISNAIEGAARFIEHSDLHIDLKSTEDQLKRIFEPTFDFASAKSTFNIINAGDIADTLKEIKRKDWVNHDKEAIELSIKFFQNLAKVLATLEKIKYYFLFGNHEKHFSLAGIDPLEIMYDYCDNFIPLGANQGSFMIGNDKIGVIHEIRGVGDIKDMTEKIQGIAPDCIYSLIGHYHAGIHKPLNGCSFVRAGINNPILFRANLEDGNIVSLNAKELILKDNKFECSQIETELYNSNYQYVKRSQ